MASNSFVTGKFRIAWPNVFTKETKPDGTPGAYSVVAIIPKGDTETLNAIKAALGAAATERFGKNLKGVRNPLKDGDTETFTNSEGVEEPKHPGCMFIRISSNQKPGVVDADVQEVIDPEQVYAGRYARASVNAWSYDTSGNKGVSLGLQNLQLLEDGERLGNSKPKPQDVFKPVALANAKPTASPSFMD